MNGILRADFRRAFLSRRFLFAALAIPIVRLFGSVDMFTGDVISSFFYSSEIYEMNVALCAAPFVAIFAVDFSHGAYGPLVIRCGIGRYAISKVIALIASTTACNVLGQAAYIAILRLHEPFMLASEYGQYLAFGEYVLGYTLLAGRPVSFLAAQIMCSSVVCVEFALASLFISTLNTNTLFVYALPFLLYLVGSYLVWVCKLPYYLVPTEQYVGHMTNVPWKDMLILFGGLAGATSIFGGLFLWSARRRIQRA